MTISGALDMSKPSTVIPVPPGTARHQLFSMAPTARPFGCSAIFKSLVGCGGSGSGSSSSQGGGILYNMVHKL